MTTKSFATELRDFIKSIRDEEGLSEIKSDNLINYLEKVINSPEDEISLAQMEKYKAELQVWIKQNDAAETVALENFRIVNLAGQGALKTMFLMNGGATVVLLAFLGKLSEKHQDKIAVFASALVIFVIGVFASAVASGLTYTSGWFYGHSEPWKRKTGHALNILTMLFGLAGYAFFIRGTWRAYRAFLGFA